MSFTAKVKQQLLKLEIDRSCCALSELCGLICFAGNIVINGEDGALRVVSENIDVARRAGALAALGLSVGEGRVQSAGSHYMLVLEGKLIPALTMLGLTDERFNSRIIYRIDPLLVSGLCCKRAFVRGAFLGGGSVADPEKTYHFELVTNHYMLSRDMSGLIEAFTLQPHTIKRKSNYVIYFKKGEDVADLLNIIGAHGALMELENARIFKDMRNQVNRHVNCETANLDKVLNAALEQIEWINIIKERIGLEDLPPRLREAAELRLENPDATLCELGNMLDKPIGKSGVNHRLKKLVEIAKGLK